MEREQEIICKFQESINTEFDKTFEVTLNNRNYKAAFPLDEIPVIRSFSKNGSIITITFSVNHKTHSFDHNKIFNLLENENEPGKFEAVVVNLSNKNKDNIFEMGREVVEEMNENETSDNSILNTKRKYLVHALYDALTSKTDSFWGFDFNNNSDIACISLK